MLSKKEVIKHSSAIQISNKITLLQRRCWNLLLANAYDDLPKKEIYEIKISDLTTALGFDSGNIEYLKKSLEEITSYTVKWNILDKDGKQEWGVASILSEAIIKEGIVSYAYSPTIRKRLYNPTMYARINLSMQNKFDSKYTLALYELFIDYFIVKIKKGETPYISVENLRELLGLEETEYKEFKAFNRDVIKKSITEINKKSDLFIEIEYKREKRRVAFLKFYIKAKKDKKILIDNLEHDGYVEIFTKLQNTFLLSPKQAETIIEKFKKIDVLEVLLVEIEEKYKKGEIKNLGAYSFKFLSEHTGIIKSKIDENIEKEKLQKKELEKNIKQEKQKIEDLKEQFNNNKQKVINSYIEKNRDSLDIFFPEFIEKYSFVLKTVLKTKNINDKNELRDILNKDNHLMMLFRAFMAEKVLDKKDNDFVEYAKTKGKEIIKIADEYYIKNGLLVNQKK